MFCRIYATDEEEGIRRCQVLLSEIDANSGALGGSKTKPFLESVDIFGFLAEHLVRKEKWKQVRIN